jgi:hypothetical protein
MVFFWKDALVDAATTWPVAEFLLTAAHCDPVFSMIGWLPAYIPYLDTADQEKFPGLKFYFDTLTEANEWWPLYKMEIMPFIEQRNIELRERVFRGELTGAQAAEQLQEDAMDEWEEAGYA